MEDPSMTWNQTVEAIRADLYRYRRATGLLLGLRTLKNPGFHYLVIWRLSRHFWMAKTPVLKNLLQRRLDRLKQKFGINIPVTVSLGPGCRINHYGGIVLNSKTVAGSNLTLSQGVTIGHSLGGKRPGCPVIGDDVFFAPQSVAIGGIQIGNGAAVGALSSAFRDVPPGGVVVGSPGRVVSTRGAAEYIVNRWVPGAAE